jgi:hypothetical protein
MKQLNSLTKRDLLAAKRYDPDDIRAYAEEYFSQERFGEAFEFYRKIEDKDGIAKVKKAVIYHGDPEVLWRIEHVDASLVTREEWARCGERAMELEKFRSAAYAFQHIGDAERQAAAEKEFIKPPSTSPPAPAASPAS